MLNSAYSEARGRIFVDADAADLIARFFWLPRSEM